MSAHTPGPWRYDMVKTGAIVHAVAKTIDDVPRYVADVHSHTHDADMRPAEYDARLIAAAPELLDALRALLSCYDEEDGWILCSADPGCPECTSGTVPHDRNTGLCPYHAAVAAVRKVEGAE